MAWGFSSLAMTGTSLPLRCDNSLDSRYVRSGTHERERNGIDPLLQTEFEVFAIFCP